MKLSIAAKVLGATAIVAGLVVGPLELLHAQKASSAKAEPAQPARPTRSVQKQTMAGKRIVHNHARKDLLEGGINFVSVCRYSHTAPDDPIVYPNLPGASHPHDFFGNGSTDAHSTYSSLQGKPSTCKINGDTAAYWTPVLFDSGKLVRPTLVRVYYTPGGKNHLTIKPFPAKLEVVAKGDNVVARWGCIGVTGETKAQDTPPTCPSGQHLVLRLRFPDCWDGVNLDSPDHTSHMAFSRRRSCPPSHPVPVPAISVNVHYPTNGGDDIKLGYVDKPVAAHADFFNAWDQITLERLVRECLNAGLHCGDHPPLT